MITLTKDAFRVVGYNNDNKHLENWYDKLIGNSDFDYNKQPPLNLKLKLNFEPLHLINK